MGKDQLTSDIGLDSADIVRVLQKYNVPGDMEHTLHVTGLALALFDALAPALKLPPEYRPLLECSSLLHDIGHYVNEKKHDRITRYLILHDAEFEAFSEEVRTALAFVAGGHRKGFGSSLSRQNQSVIDMVLRLTAILRIADSLDYTRMADVEIHSIEIIERKVVIQLSSQRSVLDMDKIKHKSQLFEEVYGFKLSVSFQNKGI